jgi:mycothiol synthase
MPSISIARAEGRRDLETVVEVVRRVSGNDVPSIADLEHWQAAHPRALLLVARTGLVDAGSGWAGPSSEPGVAQAMIRVVPEHRGEGIGGKLLEIVRAHARRLGCREVEGRLHGDDASSLGFFERRAFRVVDRRHEMVLDLATAAAGDAEPPEGVTVTTLDLRPDLVRAVFELEQSASADIPTGSVVAASGYQTWRSEMLGRPGARPEGWFLALEGSDLVAFAGVVARDGEAGSADHTMTAVRRDRRGRGLGQMLKRRQIAWAAAAGFERLIAHNHASNAPMLDINRRLGYRPRETELLIRGEVG